MGGGERLDAYTEGNKLWSQTLVKGYNKKLQAAIGMYEAGNLEGAANAMQHAWSLMPNNTNAKPTIKDGKLYMELTDEMTGESLGKPKEIDSNFLMGQIMTNDSPENAWRIVAQLCFLSQQLRVEWQHR